MSVLVGIALYIMGAWVVFIGADMVPSGWGAITAAAGTLLIYVAGAVVCKGGE